MIDISVVVPLYNEQENFQELTRRLFAVLKNLKVTYEVIFIDDGSGDKTSDLLTNFAEKNKEAKVIIFSRNFGHQVAVTAGIEHASGVVVIVMDGDLQDPPEFIPNLYSKHKEGFSVVYAVRKKRKEPALKKLCYSLYYRALNRIVSEVSLPVDSGDFSLISEDVVRVIKAMPEHNRYVRGLRSWAGFRQVGLVYERDPRLAGDTKYSFMKLIKLGYDGIFSFSYFPISFIMTFGFFASSVSFLVLMYLFYLNFVSSVQVSDLFITTTVVVFIGAIQLFTFGILGEYLRRIYDEAKQRPQFVISKKIGL